MGSVPIILDMHAEDAAILWIQRDRAVDAPHFNRKFLARLDERLEANLDGLRVAGRAGWQTARAAYDAFPEPGEVFTLAALAFGAGSKRGMGELFDILAEDEENRLTRAATSAIGWLNANALRGLVQPLLNHPRAQIRALGLGACAVHRVDPGEQLPRFLKDVPVVRCAALKLAGLLGRTDLGQLSSDEDNQTEEFRAAWASVRIGDRGASLSKLWHLANQTGPYQLRAFELAVMTTPPNDVGARLHDFGALSTRFAVRAAGYVGQVDVIEWLIDQMHNPELAQLAGESFALITGADLAFLDLDAGPPEDGGPNDDPADPRVDLNPDEELPMPDAAAVARWWESRGGQFTQHTSYILGQPVGSGAYQAAFETGFQRQRRVAALALGSTGPKLPLLNWKSREQPKNNKGHAVGFWEAMDQPFL